MRRGWLAVLASLLTRARGRGVASVRAAACRVHSNIACFVSFYPFYLPPEACAAVVERRIEDEEPVVDAANAVHLMPAAFQQALRISSR